MRSTNQVRECKAQQLYSSVVLRAIEDATNRQIGDGTGADEIVHWARSADGRSILAWAGIEANERTFSLIRECVLDRARVKRIEHFRKSARMNAAKAA